MSVVDLVHPSDYNLEETDRAWSAALKISTSGDGTIEFEDY